LGHSVYIYSKTKRLTGQLGSVMLNSQKHQRSTYTMLIVLNFLTGTLNLSSQTSQYTSRVEY